MPAETLIIRGMPELKRALKDVGDTFGRELNKSLRLLAEPVRVSAEEKAIEKIGHMTPEWAAMRTGVTSRAVYVAPKARRHGGSPRPNLAGLLMDQAMQPALDEHAPAIERGVEELIDVIGARYGF